MNKRPPVDKENYPDMFTEKAPIHEVPGNTKRAYFGDLSRVSFKEAARRVRMSTSSTNIPVYFYWRSFLYEMSGTYSNPMFKVVTPTKSSAQENLLDCIT